MSKFAKLLQLFLNDNPNLTHNERVTLVSQSYEQDEGQGAWKVTYEIPGDSFEKHHVNVDHEDLLCWIFERASGLSLDALPRHKSES